MTSYEEIIDDPKYIRVLDKGFVGLVDSMGSDSAIVQAARVSYGKGTKSVREDRGLIRYLLRKKHTSPFEMCEVKFHIKAPIFVFRQLIRHRTASLNEFSGRYSIMPDEFYIPDIDVIAEQSNTNKQGRGESINRQDAAIVQNTIENVSTSSYGLYESLIGQESNLTSFQLGLSTAFNGIARESARMVLPLNIYSELYWKQDLHNLFHLLKLRKDEHAQLEIREVANAIYGLILPLFPIACEAFEDYTLGALTLSRMEKQLLSILLQSDIPAKKVLEKMIDDAGSAKDFAQGFGLSDRELTEFRNEWQLN